MRIIFILYTILFHLNCFSQNDTLKMFFNDLPSEFKDDIYVIKNLSKKKDYPFVQLTKNEFGDYLFRKDYKNVGVQFTINDEIEMLTFLDCSIDTFSITKDELIIFNNPFPKLCRGIGLTVKTNIIKKDSLSPAIDGLANTSLFDWFVYLNLKGIFYRKCFTVNENCYVCLDIYNNHNKEEQIEESYFFDFKSKIFIRESTDWETNRIKSIKYNFNGDEIERIDSYK